jgi:hypothetical protein
VIVITVNQQFRSNHNLMENRGVRYAIPNGDREGKQAICLYVSFEDEPGRRSAAKLAELITILMRDIALANASMAKPSKRSTQRRPNMAR